MAVNGVENGSPKKAKGKNTRSKQRFSSRAIGFFIGAGGLLFVVIRMLSVSTTLVAPTSVDFDHIPLIPSNAIQSISNRSNNDLSHHDSSVSRHDEKNVTSLKVAWLMSFPNSGTSYTMTMTQSVSQRAGASNYGTEPETWNEFGVPVPLFSEHGPFVMSKLHKELPLHYILTKTHCGGACTACPEFASERSLRSFVYNCRSSGKQHMYTNEFEYISYSADFVAKAVHIIRHPLDNIVSRFHHYRKRNLELYNKTMDSFLEYCNKFDTKFAADTQTSLFVDPAVVKEFKKVPCHFDLLRDTNWHDMAFLTVRELEIPSLVLHYENYTTNFNGTVQQVMNFLQLQPRGRPPTFIRGKEYLHYYTTRQQKAAKVVLKNMASKATWKHIQHYFR